MKDYFKEETKEVKELFDLEEIIEFQLQHSVEIIRWDAHQYVCYIDKNGYGAALTMLGALVFGIKLFKEKINEKRD